VRGLFDEDSKDIKSAQAQKTLQDMEDIWDGEAAGGYQLPEAQRRILALNGGVTPASPPRPRPSKDRAADRAS
jgi:hypothetical protein